MDVVVVGGGQAGLGTGYWLARDSSLSFVILEAAAQVGGSWLDRWDSLTLFTPRRFSSLPGFRFPAGASGYPTKDEMAVYLQQYVGRFDLPVRLGQGVEAVRLVDARFESHTREAVIRARHVVVATGPFRGAYVPPAANNVDPGVVQLHSSRYRNPADIDTDDVVVVGGGNSAAQLACELAPTHRVTVASPGPFQFLPKTICGVSLYRWLYLSGVLNASADSRVARHARAHEAIIGRDLAGLVASGHVRHVPYRVVGADGDEVVLDDGTRIGTTAILWCTGFRPDYQWLGVPGALDVDGAPLHTGGASPVPGLHWMGQPWQTRLNSSLIDGVDRDAEATVWRVTH
ncbi:MAG: NAD(P)/FAD-dependent oxidoreductase [Actinomycetota bacterium]|nr:NAD(P)/FAD-dependent oxidoreductase [Actinomycetota bacterium]